MLWERQRLAFTVWNYKLILKWKLSFPFSLAHTRSRTNAWRNTIHNAWAAVKMILNGKMFSGCFRVSQTGDGEWNLFMMFVNRKQKQLKRGSIVDLENLIKIPENCRAAIKTNNFRLHKLLFALQTADNDTEHRILFRQAQIIKQIRVHFIRQPLAYGGISSRVERVWSREGRQKSRSADASSSAVMRVVNFQFPVISSVEFDKSLGTKSISHSRW